MKNHSRLLLFLIGITLIASCAVGPGKAPSTEVIIFHFNDTHSRVEEGNYAGMGYAKLSAYIEEERSMTDNVLVLDGGDTFHGQTMATLVEGESIARMMNVIGVDAMVAGNHDFNYGQDRLLELNDMTSYPILSANVDKEDQHTFLPPYMMKDIQGLRVAIFGLTTPETSYKTHPENVEGLQFLDPIVTAQSLVSQLEKEAHVIIALAHLGVDESSEFTSMDLAEEVEGIDLIVDGHSHTALPNGLMVNDTLIVQAGEHDKNLGRVVMSYVDGIITFDAALISKEEAAEITPNQEVVAIIEEVKAEIEEITSVEVGSAEVMLLGERGDVRTGETNLGNLITDAVLLATGADMVITNGGGIRASIPQGIITVGDIITVLPFGNYVVTKELSGEEIIAALEHGIDSYPETKGAFPHIAGASLLFDGSGAPGSRVVELIIQGEPVDQTRTYLVATNDFMAAGGDDYTMLANAPIVGEFDGLDEMVIQYVQSSGSVNPALDGRISIR